MRRKQSDMTSKSAGKKKKKSQEKGEVKFSTYIAKAHKQIHGAERTVSASALSTLDMMTDHLIGSLVGNAKRAMRYSKTNTFNTSAATGAASLTLTGVLKTSALGAGKIATETFANHEPPPPPPVAAA